MVIINFKLYKTRQDRFYNITTPSTTVSSGSDLFDHNNDSVTNTEIIDNPKDKLFVTNDEKEEYIIKI